MTHTFIFEPGVWEGRGKISFSMAEDQLPFKMRWTVLPKDNDQYLFSQLVEVDDFTEKMNNSFCVSSVDENGFMIELENHLVGKVEGKGVINDHVLAWEFRENEQGFEGFEIYEKSGDDYKMRAEFSAGEGLRTYVRGIISKVESSV